MASFNHRWVARGTYGSPPHTQKGNKMKHWEAPLIVAIIGTIAAVLVGEPAAALFAFALAILGYAINRKGN